MTQPFVPSRETAIVRYQVADIDRSLSFYTDQLGFHLVHRAGPVATAARGALHLLFGGWNRIVLYVDNLETEIAGLEKAKVHFRNEVESGPGGKQILIDDPDGNPIELHEAPKH